MRETQARRARAEQAQAMAIRASSTRQADDTAAYAAPARGGQRRKVEEGGQDVGVDRRRIGEHRGEEVEWKQAGRENHGLKGQILAR